MRALFLIAAALLGAAPLPAIAQAPGGASGPGPIALENEYVLVSRNAAPCAKAEPGRCEDRVIAAMGEVALGPAGKRGAGRTMMRGQIALFKAGESYEPPTDGPYFEVA